MSKAAFSVDVNNLFNSYMRKFPGKRVDYKLLLERANQIAPVVRATAYGFQNSQEVEGFINRLRQLGYDTRFKKPRLVEEENKKFKTFDWNVGICMDVVRLVTSGRVDTTIIGSSDPELVPLLQWVHGHGIRTIILSAGIGRELKNAADQFEEIGESYFELASQKEVKPEGK